MFDNDKPCDESMNTNNSISSQFPNSIKIAGFVIIIAGTIYAQAIISQILMALFISVILAQPVAWLQRKKVPQGLAIAIVFILVTAIFIGFGEVISRSISSFSENSETYENNLQEIGRSTIKLSDEMGLNITANELSNLFDTSKVMKFTASFLGELGGIMGNALTIFFLSLFLLMEVESFAIKTRFLMKEKLNTLDFLNTISKSIRHYLSIKTLTSFLTGGLIWISLSIVGVDYAILWALIAFLLNYIPNIGSIIAAVPAILFTMVQLGAGGAIWTGVIFLAANMIIGNVIEPKMMGKGMGLSTFVVFTSLIIWGFILGTVGMFLSVPLTMTIKIMLEQKTSTKWIAVLLGTHTEAHVILDKE